MMAPPPIKLIGMTIVILSAAIPIIKGQHGNTGENLGVVKGDAAEHRLFAHLMSKYNKHIRPIRKHGEITQVFFELSLFDILNLDTKNQLLVTNTEMIMKWKDNYLMWNPDDYNGTTVFRIPYTDIWFPDVILQNTAQADYYNTILSTNAIVFSTGEVELVSHGIFESICSVDTQYYPFDQQVCTLVFSSWTYDKDQIILVPGPADLSKYQANPQFFLENFFVEQHDVHNPCCKNLMSSLTYRIQVQRRTIFSLFFFIMPGILINICALMVFSLPAESGEKIGLGINSLLAMIVFLMAMTENLPPTEKLPLAGVYYGSCISMIAMNITASVFVLNLNNMGFRGYHVPEIIQNMTLFQAKIIFIRVPFMVRESWALDDIEPKKDNIVEETPIEVFTLDQDGFNPPNCKPPTPHPLKYESPPKRENSLKKKSSSNQIQVKPFEKQVEEKDDVDYSKFKDPFERRALAALEAMTEIFKKESQAGKKTTLRKNLVDEWQFVSRVLDRTLFIAFSISCFLFNVFILTSSPFRERFDYCPLEGEGSCDELTFEDIQQITMDMASNYHGTSGGDGGGFGGGH